MDELLSCPEIDEAPALPNCDDMAIFFINCHTSETLSQQFAQHNLSQTVKAFIEKSPYCVTPVRFTSRLDESS